MSDNRKIESFTVMGAQLDLDPRHGIITFLFEEKLGKKIHVVLEREQYQLTPQIVNHARLIQNNSLPLSPKIATAVVVCEYLPDSTAANKVGTGFKTLQFFSSETLLELALSSYKQEQQQDQG